MLTGEQREEFERLGVTRLTGLFTSADAERMRTHVWEALATAHGIRREEAATWTIEQPTGFQALTRSGAFDVLGGAALAEALDDLFGPFAWTGPKHWGTPLVRFPSHGTAWDVPSRQWHLDFPARGPARPLFALRVLAFLDDVEPCAGGTLVVAGSHQLIERLVGTGVLAGRRSRQVLADLMARHTWLRELWAPQTSDDRARRFMGEGALVDGIPLSVVELTGGPGEAVLMHPWALHAPAPNVRARPRFILADSVVRTGGQVS